MKNVTTTPVSQLAAAKLESVTGETITAGEIWAKQPALVLILRRPGCILCRQESLKLWKMRGDFEAMNVRQVCLLHEWREEEVKAFHPEFWGGELYHDIDKVFYKALGNGALRRGSVFDLLNPFSQAWANVREAKKTVDKSNLKGDGLTMGGLMVLGAGNVGVQFQHVETTFGDHAPTDQVVTACKLASAMQAS